MIEGEMISPKYFDGLAGELSELLQEVGKVEVADLAVRFNLSAEVLTNGIQARLGSQGCGMLRCKCTGCGRLARYERAGADVAVGIFESTELEDEAGDPQLEGRFESGQLYTPNYVARLTSQ
eukprot:gene32426-41125_t